MPACLPHLTLVNVPVCHCHPLPVLPACLLVCFLGPPWSTVSGCGCSVVSLTGCASLFVCVCALTASRNHNLSYISINIECCMYSLHPQRTMRSRTMCCAMRPSPQPSHSHPCPHPAQLLLPCCLGLRQGALQGGVGSLDFGCVECKLLMCFGLRSYGQCG